MKNALSRTEVKDMVKVVVDAHSNQVLGYHMVGSGAADILQVLLGPQLQVCWVLCRQHISIMAQ
jgi:hypothetical protein